MQALIRHLRDAVCYVFSSASLGGTEEYWSAWNYSYNYESNGFIVIIKDCLLWHITSHIPEQLYSAHLEFTELVYLEVNEN